MCGQELRKRLHAVDPNLNIVPGGIHKKKQSLEWDRAGGYFCPECKQETVRLKELTPGRWACPDCCRKYGESFSKMETSLAPLLNSENTRLARMARRQLMKKSPV